MEFESEVWRPVPGFPLYEASSRGRVRSLDRVRPHWRGGQRKIKGRMLNPIPNRGYLVVKLGGPNMARGVHQAVALAWIGEPSSGQVVNHINGVKTDNRVENLEYITNAGDLNGNSHARRRQRCEVA